MNNKEFGKQLEDRTKKFAIQVINASILLPLAPEWNVIRNQLTKSGTSIGANYTEANRSRSKADFLNRIKICESEASETVYWLGIIADLNRIDCGKVQPLIAEANELLALFTSISKRLKLKAL
jgi:four helix bundle protein